MRKPYIPQTFGLVDPTGPGSPAWEESENAIQLYNEGRRSEAGAAMSRMIRHLKTHGKSKVEVAAWKNFVRRERSAA